MLLVEMSSRNKVDRSSGCVRLLFSDATVASRAALKFKVGGTWCLRRPLGMALSEQPKNFNIRATTLNNQINMAM